MTSGTEAVEKVMGAFSRDQLEILSARKGEPGWVSELRTAAHDVFSAAAMPTTREEDWRYTDIGALVKLEAFSAPDDVAPVTGVDALPGVVRSAIARATVTGATIVQVDGSVVWQEVPAELSAQGVIVTSLEAAAREHPELVQRHLGSALGAEEGKFVALNSAFWTGGVFVHVPKGVKVEAPIRAYRAVTAPGTAVLSRTLVVADEGAEVTVVESLVSEDLAERTLSVGGAEILGEENARVHYVVEQNWGKGVIHLPTDRVVAGRDARITTLYLSLGGDVARADVRCRLDKPGSHVDLLGLYITDAGQHVDHETLQDHASPHASSNLLFKGALRDNGRSVFRGLIRVRPGAQRTDAYQTNRNLILSREARADSLPNLEIQADDVRCSHAATVGQLDEEELFYLLSRGVPKQEAVRLVVFGFFSEVLDQLELEEVKAELVRSVERKLYGVEE